jgi:hypothetical protein
MNLQFHETPSGVVSSQTDTRHNNFVGMNTPPCRDLVPHVVPHVALNRFAISIITCSQSVNAVSNPARLVVLGLDLKERETKQTITKGIMHILCFVPNNKHNV